MGGEGVMCVYHFFSHPGSHTGLKNCAAEMDWGGQEGACVYVCMCVCVFPILALTLG